MEHKCEVCGKVIKIVSGSIKNPFLRDKTVKAQCEEGHICYLPKEEITEKKK